MRNDDSVVLEVTLGDVALLLTGDIGAAVEDGLVAQLTPAPARILKPRTTAAARRRALAWWKAGGHNWCW